MFEAFFEVLGELLIQVSIEILVELGLHSFKAPFERRPNPWLAAIGYVLFGAILGGTSLLIFPTHLTPAGPWRVVNLVLSPVAAGLIMTVFGAWRLRHGEIVFRIDRFSYGYLFALSLALTRYQFAA